MLLEDLPKKAPGLLFRLVSDWRQRISSGSSEQERRLSHPLRRERSLVREDTVSGNHDNKHANSNRRFFLFVFQVATYARADLEPIENAYSDYIFF